jgi:hypothetical protein
MATTASALPRWARRVLLAVGLFQLTLRVGGLLLARRLDEGTPSSGRIRRIKTLGQVSITADSQELEELEIDLAMAGAELDLSRARPAPGGADVTFRCAMAGGEIVVPEHWRVAWDSKGVGGVAAQDPRLRSNGLDPVTADLRVHLRAVFGGVNLRVHRPDEGDA